ncbi:MAG TPA: ABC transporter permease [Solirubrobacteraceae bacterium]|nr:ABC transporter permease [Solirubrobacteraceae bacterium]
MEQGLQPDHPGLSRFRPGRPRTIGAVRRRSRRGAYALAAPGGGWLLVFFLIPILAALSISLQTGNPVTGYSLSWHFGEYSSTVSAYGAEFLRSFEYGVISTAAAFVISYPIAYWIAFHGGRHKSTLLFLILLPFFVSFVIRTLAWQFILSDEGFVLRTLENLHLLPRGTHVLSTPFAVLAGLTYNALPFMALPLYVAIEKIDRRVVRAATDLYARPSISFLRVILPLSAPGIFAGFLLVFVTNVGDYVNAEILGGPGTTMIGNIIQSAYLNNLDYPTAAALSSVLMAGLLIVIWLYARAFGTESLQEYAAA